MTWSTLLCVAVRRDGHGALERALLFQCPFSSSQNLGADVGEQTGLEVAVDGVLACAERVYHNVIQGRVGDAEDATLNVLEDDTVSGPPRAPRPRVRKRFTGGVQARIWMRTVGPERGSRGWQTWCGSPAGTGSGAPQTRCSSFPSTESGQGETHRGGRWTAARAAAPSTATWKNMQNEVSGQSGAGAWKHGARGKRRNTG